MYNCFVLPLLHREEWTKPNLFRIGASSLLIDLERQIEHGITGNYSASYMLAMS